MDNIACIPYYAHEGIVSRLERRNRRLTVALLISVFALGIETALMMKANPDDEEEL